MKENEANVNDKRPFVDATRSYMLLAGDIGGTKTLLGLFDSTSPRPQPVATDSFPTLEYDDLSAMIAAFLEAHGSRRESITAACFGVAGPVIGDTAELTNVPFGVDARRVADAFGLKRAVLLNDLQAMAYAVPVLRRSEIHVLQAGEPQPGGNIAVIAAGTGLGQALLHNVNGRFVPSPTEAGHADFAARTEREIVVLRALTAKFGRVEVERVVSGRGLSNLHRIVHDDRRCAAGIDPEDLESPAAISTAALERRCKECVEAFDIFIEAYGAETGNLALRAMATAGVFLGGGIAPKILGALDAGPFMHAFRAKTPLEPLLARIPVNVILNAESGLLGAAVFAAANCDTNDM